MKDLMVLPEQQNELEAVFIEGSNFDPVISQIREQAKNLPLDMSVKKNRDEIASFAYKIAKSKTAVEKAGAAISAKYKELPKKIDASRRAYKDAFEKLQGEVRAPLNEWERVEQARIDRHQLSIDNIALSTSLTSEDCAANIESAIAMLNELKIDGSWDEFETEAHRVKSGALDRSNDLLCKRVKYEAEQAELETLRKQAAEQERKDSEAQIAADAAANAKAAAEQAAAKAVEDARRAEAQAMRDLELAEQRRIAQEKQAELDKIEAENRAKQAAENARLAEVKRVADEQVKSDAEQASRESDKKHKGKINREALAALISHAGLDDSQARNVVTAIAKGLINNVSIKY